MEQPPPPAIRCRFELVHLEAECQRENGWKPTLGTTSADIVRAGIVIVEFLNALLGDSRVQACFQRLREKVNMPKARGDPSIDEYCGHMRRYQRAILTDIQRFVEDTLHFPPPQVFPSSLVMDLESAFWSHVNSLYCGEPLPRSIPYVLAYSVPPAPEVHLPAFDTVPGEGVWTAIQRFRQFMQEVEVAQSRLYRALRRQKADHMPVDLILEARAGVGKYARWFYQKRVCGKSYSAIARDASADRKTVRRGIDIAGKLMNSALAL